MKIPYIIKAAAALAMATGLAGCFDVTMEVTVVDADKAIAKIESTVSSELISLADIESGDADFCDEAGEITENDDGTITCIEIHEGSFADVFPDEGDDEPQPTIETIAPGQVKVTFPTSTMAEDMGMSAGDEEMDAQTKAMMVQMFEGKAITMRIAGPKIIETNMVLSDDGKSAELSVPFMDMVEGTLSIDEDSYAIVQLP